MALFFMALSFLVFGIGIFMCYERQHPSYVLFYITAAWFQGIAIGLSSAN